MLTAESPLMDITASSAEDSKSNSNFVTTKASSNGQNDEAFLAMLRIFYQRLFPVKEFYQWLSYGNLQKNQFQNREFSFTLASEAYLRFLSFSSPEELKSELLRLTPVKIDLGAVYNIKPKDKKMFKAGAFQPLERELVFDIDMTDYDEVRSCCQGGDVCLKCWDFMTISIKIIDRVLREDFGFSDLLWVYSGRRGVHCWIADERARKLTAEGRKSIVNYIEVVKGGDGQTRKVNLPMGKGNLHPSLIRAQQILDQYFPKTLLKNQDILGTPEKWQKVLQLIPDEESKKRLDNYFSKHKTMSSVDKWDVIVNELQDNKKRRTQMMSAQRDIVFQYTYPRLDDHVSTGVNHLLKSPFCVHPKTGRVCVPIDPKNCDAFDPLNVPTLKQLIQELDELPKEEVKKESSPDENDDCAMNADDDEIKSAKIKTSGSSSLYEKTSLKPYIDLYKKFLNGLDVSIREELRKRRLENDKELFF